jgi:hypothetical protein
MPRLTAFALNLSLALSLTALFAACGTASMPATAPPIDVKDRQPPRPEIKRNPHPTAYEIVMRIENPPGPFAVIEGFMQYDTGFDNPCMPDLGGMAGTRMRLSESIPVRYEKIAENTYRGVVYTDLLVAEDYYGLGVCEWKMVAARVSLKATGAPGETSFFENIFYDDLVSMDSYQAYFSRRWYPRDAVIEDMRIPGETSQEKFKPEFRADLFKLDFSIRKLTP